MQDVDELHIDADQPLQDDEIISLFSQFKNIERLGLCVSGGPDSVAMMHLAARWQKLEEVTPELHILTVDHGLRKAAKQETSAVKTWAEELGLNCSILTVDSVSPDSNIQAYARLERYRLLVEKAWSLGIKTITTAHTLDDQAETILMRLKNRSGYYGLSGILASNPHYGINVVRPLLCLKKARLLSCLKAWKVDYFEDPSNRDHRFQRVRFRRLLEEIARKGVDATRIARFGNSCLPLRVKVDEQVSELAHKSVQIWPQGYCIIDLSVFLPAKRNVKNRLLKNIMMCVGGAHYPPRRKRFEQLADALENTEEFSRTLGGCQLERSDNSLVIWRELGRTGLPETPVRQLETPLLWDRRFRIDIEMDDQIDPEKTALVVRSLREEGRIQAQDQGLDFDLPVAISETLPSIWRDDELVSVPHYSDFHVSNNLGLTSRASWVRHVS